VEIFYSDVVVENEDGSATNDLTIRDPIETN